MIHVTERKLTVRAGLAGLGLAVCLGAPACGGDDAPSSPDVWAMVDGREIRKDDVEKAYRRVSPPNQSLSKEEELTAKLSLLNEMIVQDILVAKAAALNLTVTDSEIETAFNERKKNMPEDAFQKELNARGLTTDDMKAGLRRELLADKVVEREVNSRVVVTDQEITDYYSANRAKFNLAETAYRIAQIVVTPVRDQQLNNRKGSDAATPAEADAKVQMLMGQLKGGAEFGALAMDYSEDPQSAPQGGDMGYVPMSRLQQAPPLLRDAVLKTTPGSVSRVSADGAHSLVLVVSKEEAGQRDLNTPGVKDGITTSLRDQRVQLLRTAFLTSARADAKVVNFLSRQIVQATGKLPAPVLPGAPGK
jgi:peptidyl-prolyl cis-trans isomerase SurA